MLLARIGMLGTLLGLCACTIPNEAHCGNQGGDATCSERFGAPMYCDICVAANDGCVEAMPEDACRLGEHASDGSASDTSTSTSTDPTTAASTAASSTTTPLSTAGPGESSAESTTDAPDDSTSTAPTESSESTASDPTETSTTSDPTTGDDCTPVLQPCENDDECCEDLVCGDVTGTCGVA